MEKRIIIRVFIEKEAVIENSMMITTLRKQYKYIYIYMTSVPEKMIKMIIRFLG
jgi:hypothetical protein